MGRANQNKKPTSKRTHFFQEILMWVPELIILPFRLLIYVGRMIARMITN